MMSRTHNTNMATQLLVNTTDLHYRPTVLLFGAALRLICTRRRNAICAVEGGDRKLIDVGVLYKLLCTCFYCIPEMNTFFDKNLIISEFETLLTDKLDSSYSI